MAGRSHAPSGRSLTEQLLVADQLQVETFRGFFEHLAVGGVQISTDGRFVEVNDRFVELTGYRREELLEMRVGDLDHPEDRAPDRERWAAFLSDSSAGYDVEKRYIRRDGAVIWVHVTAARIPIGVSDSLIAKTVEDITERVTASHALREREEKLREALAVKEEFLGLVSHELRTPLTVILGLANVMTRASMAPEDTQSVVMEIRESAEHLASLLESMLVLARVGDEQPSLEPILLVRAMRRAIAHHRDVFPQRRVDLHVRTDNSLVDGHEPWIAQVIGNMLGNAEKYSPGAGGIDVVIKRERGDVTVTVLDEGSGIADKDLPHLFEPFYRSERAAEQSGGLGLGLAVCKRLIELQDGRIWAASRPDRGAEFGFALPGLDDDED